MNPDQAPAFADQKLHALLELAGDAALDALDFGVIGFDADGVVRRYNAFESRAAGLSPERVLGHAFFTVVAPCMNNFMVAQRFDDALQAGTTLDDTIDYVLTLRMRPVKVRLRLLAAPTEALRYVLVHRAG
jgi:photoactive yellow protein